MFAVQLVRSFLFSRMVAVVAQSVFCCSFCPLLVVVGEGVPRVCAKLAAEALLAFSGSPTTSCLAPSPSCLAHSPRCLTSLLSLRRNVLFACFMSIWVFAGRSVWNWLCWDNGTLSDWEMTADLCFGSFAGKGGGTVVAVDVCEIDLQ